MADPKARKKSKENWVRSGGAYGDTSMEDMEAYNAAGAGVDEVLKEVGADPNAGIGGKRQEGAEL